MTEKRLFAITKDMDSYLLILKIAERCNYSVLQSSNMPEIQAGYKSFNPSLVILDLDFGDMDGVMLLNYLSNIQCKTPIIIMGHEDERLIMAIKHIGEVKGLIISGVLKKPLEEDELEQALGGLVHNKVAQVDAIKLARALEDNNFEMYYQPKIHIKNKQLHGMESLIRWRQHNGEMIPPMEFIPVAEESGLIIPLTHWVIRRVFEDCSKFSKHNKGRLVRFYINLSPKILNNLAFPDEVAKLAKECEVSPASIGFEVTESGVSHQSEAILEVLTRLRILGFALSIDDFGTGYSSIAELQRLPFNELKVDKRFVNDLANSSATETIVRSTIELGHNLGMDLVAEGVETFEILNMLHNLDCDISQGYLMSKPLSMNDFIKWCDKHIDDNLYWDGEEEL